MAGLCAVAVIVVLTLYNILSKGRLLRTLDVSM